MGTAKSMHLRKLPEGQGNKPEKIIQKNLWYSHRTESSAHSHYTEWKPQFMEHQEEKPEDFASVVETIDTRLNVGMVLPNKA